MPVQNIANCISMALTKKPNVGISMDRRTLEFYQPRCLYDIDLVAMNSHERLMMMVEHIATKNWSTKETLVEMITQVTEHFGWNKRVAFTAPFERMLYDQQFITKAQAVTQG